MRQTIKNTFKGIFAKFTLMFILVGLIPITGMTYLIYDKVPEEIESYMVNSYSEILLYASENISQKLENYDLVTKNIYHYGQGEDYTLASALKGLDYENLPVEVDKLTEDYLRTVLNSDPYIESAFLLGPDSEVFRYYSKSASYYYEDIDMTYLPTFNTIYLNQKLLTILPSHVESYFDLSNKRVLTFARNYLDLNYLPETDYILATLLIDVNVSFINDIVEQMGLNEEGTIYVIDKNDYNIYSSSNDLYAGLDIYSKMKAGIDKESSGYQILNNQYLFYQDIAASDWLLIYATDKSNVMHLIEDFKAITGVIIIGIMFAMIFVAITFSDNLSKPLRSIIEQMKEVSSGNLKTKVQVKGSYEVTELAGAFNVMTDQLRSHIDKAYGAQIKQREAELNALKTQIRPHYLYNTLEIIRMSALEEDATNTREMIQSLSEQLKYVIGQYGDRVSLGTELEMVENYFTIIKKRYEGRITLSIDIPKEYYTYTVLKLLLQPLVENAVVHGLKVKKGKGKVRVSGKVVDDVMLLYVMDDGVGMSETTLAEIKTLIDSTQMGNTSNGNWENIGLKNVHDRIQMIYGDQYGLSISSKENLGTKMSLCFPIEER